MEELLISITKGLVDDRTKDSVDIDEPNEERLSVLLCVPQLPAMMQKYQSKLINPKIPCKTRGFSFV